MALLTSDPGAAAVVAPVAEELLRELSAFGLMAAGQGIELDQLARYAERAEAAATIMAAAEAGAGLRFGDEPLPFWQDPAHTDGSWSLAGFTTDADAPPPSRVVAAMFTGWQLALHGVARWHLLRSVLWHASRHGVGAGLDWAVRLCAAGCLLDRDDLEIVVATVIAALDQAGSEQRAVASLLGGDVPATPADFAAATLSPETIAPGPAASPAAADLAAPLLRTLTVLAEETRRAPDLGAWILGQQRLFNTVGPVLKALRRMLPRPPLVLRAVMTQLAEINADAGSHALALKGAKQGLPSFHGLAMSALPVASQYRARLGDGWRDRLLHERVLVPDDLRTLILEVDEEWPPGADSPALAPFLRRQIGRIKQRCPEAWKSLPPRYANAYVHALRPELGNPGFVPAVPVSAHVLIPHPDVQRVFAHHGVDDPDEQVKLLRRAALSRPGRYLTARDRLSFQQIQGALAGTVPLSLHTDVSAQPPKLTWEPSELIDDLVYAWARAGAEAVREMLAGAIAQATALIGQGEALDAITLLMTAKQFYPWSADVDGALAVALLAHGDRDAFLHAITTTLALAPQHGQSWLVLADTLGVMAEHADEANLSRSIAEILTTAHQPS
ncbi:MAG TPA: hypothetical protein VFU73_09690 [Actinocrinis sp.]|nr:hypothetical protein [Actinocrinis sp.]